MSEFQIDPTSQPLSKRAARRLIQRAFVLTGRDRVVRRHIREVRLTTLWVLEDWHLNWTVVLDRGKLEFDRRPAKRPDVTLTWPTAGDFFRQVESGGRGDQAYAFAGATSLGRISQLLFQAFSASLRQVFREPVDENGVRLA